MNIRPITSNDYERLRDVVNDWGNHTNVYQIVPRLFFDHFQTTSFLIEQNGETVGLFIGFISQTDAQEAYAHFLGVNPKYRQQGIGRQLYQHFFETVKKMGCRQVSCITAPINRVSIAFHEALGFTSEKIKDYQGPGEDKILFTYILDKIC